MTPPILTAAAVERGDGEPADATGRAGAGVYVLPASFAQARLWFLHGLEPESPAYNIPLAYRLRGGLHLPALARSLSALARRHEALRTTFALEDDEPVQIVAPPAPVPLPVVDLGALSRARRERELARRLETEARRPFDLALGPLFRALVLRLARREHVLFLGVHHAVADGWSLGIVARELSAGYASVRSGSPPSLDELPIQYADFAAWQRERLAGAAAEDLLSFWRETLRDAPPVLDLPFARSRPTARSNRAARRVRRLDQVAIERLERLARERGATRFMALIALFGLALHRLAPWSGRSDVVVGTPVAGRALEETEGLIGLFVNTLVLRFDLAGEPTVGELLERVRDTCLAAFAHQELPFERLVEELAPERGLGHDPLVQVAFVLRDEPADQALRLPGLEVEALELGTGTVKFDLALSLPAAAGGAAAYLDFRVDLLEAADAARLLECLEALLGAAAGDPRRRIDELPLLPRAARHQLLHEWSSGTAAASLGEDETLHGRFAEQARRRPDAAALLGDGQVVSYGELARRAAGVARGLRRRGVVAGDLVALYSDRVPDLVAALVGILDAGAAYLPLDPSYPRERLAFMLEDAGVAAVVTQEALRGDLPEVAAPVLLLDREPEDRAAAGGAPPPGGPRSRAYVIYTSGSTGRPKGVQVSHGNVLRLMDRTEPWYRFGADDVWTLFHSYAFDFSVWELWGALLYGGRVVVVPYWVSRSPGELRALLARERVTVLNQTPSAFGQLVAADAAAADEPADELALRWVIFGGEALEPGSLAPWFARHGDRRPRLVNMYGITETTVHVTYRPVSRADVGTARASPIGRPIPDLSLHVLDGGGELLPAGAAGELSVGGAGVSGGYLARPGLTAERFVPDGFGGEPGARRYRSGDLVRRLADGELDYLGRIDHQVQLRGFRVELGEIEAALAAHPAVAQAVVVARRDRPGDQRLIAYAVADGAGRPEVAALRAHLAGRLPEYMVPGAIVVLDELPLTPTGKVDRKALPEPEPSRVAEAWAPPRGPLEELVAGIWSEVLGVGPVGAHDDFFALGGHSLLATRVVSRLRDLAGSAVPLRRLFEGPTVAALAAVVEELRRGPSPSRQPPLGRRPDPEVPAPASFAQERLWFLDQLEGPGAVYGITGGLRLEGELSVAALAGALARVVTRHEALRTRFDRRGGEVVQVVEPEGARPLPAVVDLAGLGPGARRREAEALAAREAARPFDLARGPLLRALLVREGAEGHLLLLAVHHIVFDGWSLGVLFRELAELYDALRAARRPALPEPSLQYGDYAAWQREWLAGEALDEQLAYWRAHLAGAPEALELPADRPRPAVPSHRGGRQRLRLPRRLTEDLHALARERGATLFMVLLAGYAALLSRLGGSRDVAVGTPTAGRARAELEGLIGFFVNTLVLRTDLSGRPGFGELVERVRAAALGAWDHQDLPFERLVQELAPERTLGRSPLVQAVFTLQNAAPALPRLPGLEVAPVEVGSATAKFDLTLALRETEEGALAGELEYSRDLFEATTARRWAGLYGALLEAAVAAPETPVAELSWLRAAERHQLLAEWNDTAVAYPRERSIPELFGEQVARRPEAVALRQGERWWSYGELARRSAAVASRLVAAGVGPGALVALAAERSPELIAGLLGVLEAGGAYLPLDLSYPAERLDFMLEDGEVAALVAAEGSLARLPAAALARLAGRVVPLAAAAGAVGSGERAPAGGSGARSLAYALYTSGSTGRPKGVAVEHRSVVRLVKGADYARLGEEEVFLQLAPLPFDASTLEIWGALLNGGRLELFPPGAPSLAELGRELEASRVTVLWLTAGLFHQMSEQELPRLAGVGQLLAGGDVLSLPHVARVRSVLGPDQTLVNGYGPTEGTTFTCCHRMGPAAAGSEDRAGAPVPIGRPIASTRVYLLDGELRTAPLGVAGELYLGGDGVARGYLGRPALTAAAFVPSPFEEYESSGDQHPLGGVRGGEPGARQVVSGGAPGARLYRTGDLARWLPGGEVEFLGRIDGQVKLRGFRIELGEVESVLVAHPAVAQAVAVVREDRPGDRRLVAYAVPAAAAERPDGGALRAHLAARLPDYMVPSAVVTLPELPLDPNGKVDRRALPAPEAEAGAAAAERVPPRGPLEELVAGVWSEVLGAGPVGAHDDFFALGGHSLLATRVVSRLRELAGVEVALRRLFEGPTVAELAAAVEELRRGAAGRQRPPLARRPHPELPAPASFAQERLWFLDQLEGPGAAYVVAGGLRLAGRLDLPAFGGALRAVVARHEALRTRFESRGGAVVQVTGTPGPGSPRPLPAVVDLAGLEEGARRRESEALRRRAALRPFNLARGPLFRALLLREGREAHGLLLAVHHIVFDGWSLGVLWREVTEAYAARRAGRRPALPELPVQYGDYAAWQREWLAGEALDEQLAYWRGHLAGAPEALALPADRPRPAARSPRGGREPLALPRELTDRLRALARERGATLFMVLLAGFSALLSRLAGSADVPVGTPVAGRTRSELEGLIGFFVNTLVLRADLSGRPGFGELVERVREAALGAWSHQDLPFERLVEELAPERTLGRSPLVQAVFALQNGVPALPGLAGLESAPIALPATTAKFDLTLVTWEDEEGGLLGELEYSRDLFEATTARRWAGLYGALLEAAVAAPETPVAELSWLRAAERHQLLAEWNDTAVAYPRERSIPELFGEQVARRPEAVALRQGERWWSYGELARRSAAVASRLVAAGVGPGALVALAAERSPELIAGLLGVLEAGGAYLPLDLSYPAERLDFMLEDGEVAALVAAEGSLARLPAAALARLAGRVVPLAAAAGAVGSGERAPAGGSGARSLAYALYTSGSTGRPKGVAVEHRSVVRLVKGADYARLGEEEVFLQLAPLPFDASTLEIWGALLNGGRLELFPPGAPSLAELGRELEASRVTVLWLTAGLFHQMSEQELPRLAGVGQLLAGGDVLSVPHVARVRSVLGPDQTLVNGYGPTEGTTFTCCHRMGPAAAGSEDRAGAPVPIGRPIASTRVYLLDGELRTAPLGVAGELYLGGDGVARGYLGRPALTAAAFVPSPFEEYESSGDQHPLGGVRGGEPGARQVVSCGAPGARLYRTGDLARWLPGGEVEFLGRIDGQVKLRGFRIELGEVESVLVAHPAVAQAVAVVREDRPGDRRLVAYAVPAAAAERPDGGALRAHLAARLPDYMVPSAVVTLPELPLDPNGKVDRRALPAPEAEAGAAAAERVPPRGPLEELVAGVWSEVLGAGPVDAHDDFFALGGHSLLATRVVSRLRELAGVEVALRRLFEGPTVAELAAAVEELRRGAAGRQRPPLARRPHPELPAPASFAQERLWFLDQLEGPGAAYVVAGGLRLAGELAVPALAAALGLLLARHEALRTRFEARNPSRREAAQVVQVIAPPRPVPLPVVELAGLPAARRAAALDRLGRREAARAFDLARGPLFRALLVRSGRREHALLLAVHHVVFDGWSLEVLLRELAELYGARRSGRPPALPTLPLQYADYALWQRAWLAGGPLEEQLGYWRRRLAGSPAALELPADRPRPAVQSHRGGRARLRLPAALADDLRALARERGATLFMVLLAGFSALLSRLAGSADVPVGTPVAGRRHPELEGLIGLFVNTLVLRVDLAGDPGFAELVGRVRETALEAWDHQDLPFERLVEELAPERALGHSPLFQAMLVLQNTSSGAPRLPGLAVEPFEPERRAARLDLTLGLVEAGAEIRGDVEYDRDLFDPTTVARFGDAFRQLLESAVARPQERVSELSLLAPAARHQLLHEWNDTALPEPEPGLLHGWVRAQAGRTPEAVALVAGRQRWSYGELGRRAGALADHLRRLGLGPEERVGVCLERSPEMVMALLAILEAGGAYVALDPGYPPERLAMILEDAGAGPGAGGAPPRVLTRERFLDRLPRAARERAVVLERLDRREPPGGDYAPAAGRRTAARPEPANLAYLLYTSGSTGRPKGVAVEHRSAAALLAWAAAAFAPDEIAGTLAATSINFDLSVFELFVPLSRGATVILADDALALAELEEAPRVTLVNTVPSAMTELVRMAALPESVRTVNLAGEPLKRSLADGVYAAARVERVLNLYGPSEDTTYSTWAAVRASDPAEPTIGRPVSGTRARVLDPALREAPIGVVGELCLAGRGLARGYLGRPGQSAERFVPDPAPPAPGGRIYRTGDLVRRLAGGELRFLGRMDHQVKLRGFRIELGEVESALLARPEVRAAVALVREDASGDRRLVAYAVGEAGAAPEPETLRRALAETLPAFMVPAAIVVLDELPLTPNRKVDRKALPPPEPGSGPAAAGAGAAAAPPRDALEELLAGLWAEVLGLPAVGIRDGFFALGGHSLLATRLIARVRQTLGVDLPLRRLFERPTVEGLAEVLRGAGPGAAEEPIARVPRDRDLPLSFAQERLWFLDRLDPGTTAYNVPALFRLRGELRRELLARALREVVRRHEALRTVFVEEEGRPAQRIGPVPPALLALIDLAGLPPATAEAEAARLAGRSARRLFDLAAGPLFSAWLLRLAEREHRLAWCVHHIAADGWSLGVLLRELTALYDAWSRGRPSPLPEPPVQYADFAAWQRRRAETGADQAEPWRRLMAGAPPALELPTDRPRPPVPSHRGGREWRLVPAALLQRLRELAAGESATLFMVLLAALDTVLARWSGQRDLLVGTPVAGRARGEVEGLIGMFLNTLVLRLDLAADGGGEPTFRELLRRAREAALDAYGHQDVQFERLLEELEVERDLARTPLFQVLLNVLNFPRARVPLEGLEIELVDSGAGVEAKFDLTLYAAEAAQGLALHLVYAADLFDAPRMAELLDQLHGLLVQAADDPDRALDAYSLRTAAAAARLPDPAAPLSDRFEGAVHELFFARAEAVPDRVAVAAEGGAWSYGALARAADRLARRLAAAGVGRGDRVAVHARRSPELALALLGTLRAGAAFVVLDPAHPPRRLAEVVERARPRALLRLGAGPLPELLEEAVARLRPRLDLDLGLGVGWGLDAGLDPGSDPESDRLASPGAAMGPDDVAYVAFTSGSTGEPKGIVGRHGPLSHFIPWRCRELGLGRDDRYSMLSGLGHDPLHRDLFVPLTTGGTVTVPDPERLGDPGWLAAWLARERVTVAHLTPAMGRLVTSGEPEEAPGVAAAGLPDLRRAFFVGEALRRGDLRRLRRIAPAVRCFNHYGATETQQALAVQAVESDGGAPEEVVPLGAGAGAAQLLVLGPSGPLAGVCELGEIAFRSPHLAQGYLDDPAATAERFVPDPFAGAGQGGGRLYRTGDLGRYRPDGAVDFAGRADLQVQVRGFRVELGAVEAALAEHPALAAAAVVAGAEPGGTRLTGYYVTAAGAAPPEPDALRSHLAERLPEYMIPAALAPLPRLPRTPNGKLDRRALAELGRAGVAVEAGAASGAGAPAGAEPPRTPIEEILATIWRQVLEVEGVGRRDDFFRLGGHSLLATQVVSRVGRALGVELRVRDLFERPTLVGLASRIAERRGERSERAAPGPDGRPGSAAGERTALLSFGQERLWFLERLGAGGAAYNMPVAFELRGPLDAPVLAAALAALGRRHEALRTRFESARGEPRQVIAPPEEARLPLPVADLSGLGAGRAGREALRLGAAEAALPFDLERRPLARSRLLRLGPERHALLLTVHHIVADGWSLELLLRELATLYGARLRGEPSPLPALPRQFADLARERREALSAERIAGGLGFWRRRLAGAPAVLDLPLDRPRPRLQSYRGARRWLAVPDGLARALEALARDRQATRFMTLLAGLQALLWRVSGGQSPPIGTPIAGRDRLESEGVVGFFADTLVLYCDLSDDPPFAELLGRAREVTLDAHEHQDLPFERLVEELQPERNLAHSPLFQVMLVLQNASATPVGFPGLEARPMRVAARTARFDLVLIAGEERGPGRSRLQVKLEYNRDLFDPTTAARLLGQCLTLLGAAAAAPGTPLSELPLLAPAERHQLLREWNDSRSPYPRELRLHQGFAARAARAPDAVALESPGEGRPLRITYGDLAARASRLARGLAALGVGPGSRVGIYLGRGPEMVVAVLATLEAGGAYVPLEARWPNDRLRFIVEVEGIRHLLTQASRLARAAEVAGEPLEHLIALDDPGAAPAPDGARLWSPAALEALGGRAPASAGADGLAYVIFTSGSTGRPKGVMVRHRPAVNLVHWVNSTFGVGPGDRLLFVTALSFDLSVYDLLGVLAAGATVRIASADEVLDPGRQARILIQEPITFWDSAPAALQQLAPFFPPPGVERGPPPALRLVFLSGDWIPVSLPDRVRAAFGGARVVSLGGATEATVWSNWFPVGEVDPAWASIPYGRPIANARYHVLDPGLRPCPVGVAGDLYIAGECLSTGYSGAPAQTAASYLPDPFGAPGGVLYRTGDRARYRSDGSLEFLGRLDTQVKMRGFRIELGEIEAVVAAHPGVAEAVVLAREDAPGDRRLVAYFIPRDPPADAEALRRLAGEKLPDYMVPAAFVALPGWPLSATGKLDRQALPAPEASRAAAGDGAFVPPASALERTIAAVWREVLEVERVGREESFFDLGGHSLLLARVQARLQEELGSPVAMIDLFRHPTVRSLARHLAPEPSPAAPAEPAAARPRPAAADRRIALIGLAGRFPGAKSAERFWQNLRAGVESIRHFSDEELRAAGFPPEILADPRLVRAHGVLDDPDLFDAAFFGYSPREAQVIDPQQRLFLEVAWEALESAGYGAEDGRGAVGVFAGVSENSYAREIHRRPELVRALGPHQISIANNPDYLPTRVSYKLGLDGPSVNVQTACSTSLVAVHLACQSLLAGDCDLALAGGAAVRAREVHPYRYEEGGTASPDGRLRAFDARAGGLVGGSGVGAVVLKRLADALADGDTVRAVIRGTAANNDGARRIGFTAPGVDGQTAAIRAALAAAGVPAASIGYVEAHGTATALGDPIEVAALTRAFAPAAGDAAPPPAARRQWCALGSVKTNVGHLDAAAGVTGLIKTVLALEHREIPPSLHFERPNPEIDFAASPFFVNTRLRLWAADGAPRRAGVSSFGLGGTNAHAVLEEAPAPAAEAGEGGAGAVKARGAELLVLAARSEAALERATGELARHLAAHPELALGDVAWTLQAGRRAFPWRRAVVARAGAASPPGEPAANLLASRALEERDRRWERSGLAPEEPPRIAFLFPGQGAQHPGMAEALYREEPVFRETLERCLEVLEPELGLDLRQALFPAAGAPAEAAADRLAATELAQPALFAVEYALARLWQSWGVEPAALVGHSIGEYVAAALAGVFALEDALRLVAARGRLMAALPGGAMLAVRLAEADLAPLLAAGGPVELAAVNAPDACVVSGPHEAVAALRDRLERAGIESRGLHTSHAFHSAMMAPAVEPFRELVARVERRPPAIPFASNLTGGWITAAEAADPDYWARQLRGTVRFAAGLGTVVGSAEQAAGWALLEVGPGRTLATLARRHPAAGEARAIVPSLRHPRQAGSDTERLLAALGALWVAGQPVDWRGHHRGVAGSAGRRRVPLPTYPFERRSHWLEGLPMVARSADRPAEEAPGESAAGRTPPALTAAEARVAEVWRELLGVEETAPGDDFFELGGTSLMAVQLGSRMREALGVALPSDFLLQASTLAEQAALVTEIEGSGGPGADGEPARPAPAPSCLIRLQGGADGRPPLFAVHQVGGHVYSFRALAKALGPAQPFYGLRSRGLEPGEGEPLRSVEAMAEHYLALVRELQGAGPYRLAGASMGGMIAFELAHRLQAAGEEVALLALMDTPCGEQMPRRPQEPADFTALIFAGVGLPLTYEELRPLDPEAQLVHALEKARAMGAVGPDFDLGEARRLLAVLEANVEALYGYRPRPYPGPVVLYRAAERRNQDSARPELAWIELAAGGLDFVVVPGNHATMHEPPHVQAMADDLRRRLEGR